MSKLDLIPETENVRALYGNPEEQTQILAVDGGLQNVIGMEHAWSTRPKSMDFLDKESPFYQIKKLSTELYLRFLKPHLSELPATSMVLDAGCGIGRFTLEMARRYEKVVSIDPCRSSIMACRHHIETSGMKNVETHWADLAWLETLPPKVFDLIIATELVCYSEDPALVMKRLLRVAKPGAIVFLSVESKPGALAVRNLGSPVNLIDSYFGKPFTSNRDQHVIFFNEGSFLSLLSNSGLLNVVLEGSHYFVEGVFWQSVDDDLLAERQYVHSIIDAENECRNDPLLAPLARVLSAIGKTPV